MVISTVWESEFLVIVSQFVFHWSDVEKSPEVRILGWFVPILALFNTQVVLTQLCMRI